MSPIRWFAIALLFVCLASSRAALPDGPAAYADLLQKAVRLAQTEPASDATFAAIKEAFAASLQAREKKNAAGEIYVWSDEERSAHKLMMETLLAQHMARPDLLDVPFDVYLAYIDYQDRIRTFEAIRAGSPHRAVRQEMDVSAMTARVDYLYMHDLDEQARVQLWAQIRKDAVFILDTHPANSLHRSTAMMFLATLEHAQGRALSDLKAQTVAGVADSLDRYAGKIVLLDFWATWCGSCVRGHPDLAAFKREMKGRPFEIIGISVDDERQTAARYVDRHDVPWVQWHTGILAPLVAELGIYGYPTYILLDTNRVIRNRLEIFPESFKNQIRELVTQRERELSAHGGTDAHEAKKPVG